MQHLRHFFPNRVMAGLKMIFTSKMECKTSNDVFSFEFIISRSLRSFCFPTLIPEQMTLRATI